MTLEEFILLHESDDTAALLLARHRFPDIDIDLAATTIDCRRRLRKKVPAWYAVPSLLYPNRLAAEQCSSEETARVKASIALSVAAEGYCFQTALRSAPGPMRTSGPLPPSYVAEGGHGFENNTFLRNSEGGATYIGGSSSNKAVFEDEQAVLGDASSGKAVFEDKTWRIADLTGGMGVDSWAFSQAFGEVLYNEMQEGLAKATQDNFGKLGVTNVRFSSHQLVPGNLKDILGDFKPDLIFMDPARRAEDGRKVFRLADCQPDVLSLLPELMDACPDLLLKLSPMADITQLSRELPGLKSVFILGAGGECKELFLHLERGFTGHYAIIICESDHTLSFCSNAADAKEGVGYENVSTPGHGQGVTLLFEPGKALAKAGMFRQIGERFGLSQLGASTHLYTAESIPEELQPFGKVFVIEEVLPLNNETFRSLRKRIPAAEITARNLPLTSDALRKKLGIASGGTQHLFGVQMDAEGKVLIVAKIKSAKSADN